ncbi:hypothetical protein M0813_14471 [Anaeramoeba flamelloides]|uniref:Uncharacterized protein n=1 Tax=Anaeramoeba flamelloides TaxID=1746091 RepID=A0ABQ8Z620_9EUKA|nr:hypothetical protein M0813_14471 [Anaeramoeba flamelloides]
MENKQAEINTLQKANLLLRDKLEKSPGQKDLNCRKTKKSSLKRTKLMKKLKKKNLHFRKQNRLLKKRIKNLRKKIQDLKNQLNEDPEKVENKEEKVHKEDQELMQNNQYIDYGNEKNDQSNKKLCNDQLKRENKDQQKEIGSLKEMLITLLSQSEENKKLLIEREKLLKEFRLKNESLSIKLNRSLEIINRQKVKIGKNFSQQSQFEMQSNGILISELKDKITRTETISDMRAVLLQDLKKQNNSLKSQIKEMFDTQFKKEQEQENRLYQHNLETKKFQNLIQNYTFQIDQLKQEANLLETRCHTLSSQNRELENKIQKNLSLKQNTCSSKSNFYENSSQLFNSLLTSLNTSKIGCNSNSQTNSKTNHNSDIDLFKTNQEIEKMEKQIQNLLNDHKENEKNKKENLKKEILEKENGNVKEIKNGNECENNTDKILLKNEKKGVDVNKKENNSTTEGTTEGPSESESESESESGNESESEVGTRSGSENESESECGSNNDNENGMGNLSDKEFIEVDYVGENINSIKQSKAKNHDNNQEKEKKVEEEGGWEEWKDTLSQSNLNGILSPLRIESVHNTPKVKKNGRVTNLFIQSLLRDFKPKEQYLQESDKENHIKKEDLEENQNKHSLDFAPKQKKIKKLIQTIKKNTPDFDLAKFAEYVKSNVPDHDYYEDLNELEQELNLFKQEFEELQDINFEKNTNIDNDLDIAIENNINKDIKNDVNPDMEEGYENGLENVNEKETNTTQQERKSSSPIEKERDLKRENKKKSVKKKNSFQNCQIY